MSCSVSFCNSLKLKKFEKKLKKIKILVFLFLDAHTAIGKMFASLHLSSSVTAFVHVCFFFVLFVFLYFLECKFRQTPHYFREIR